MTIATWYWVILIVWILFNGIGWFYDDNRVQRAGNVVLIVLLVLLGFLTAGSPVK